METRTKTQDSWPVLQALRPCLFSNMEAIQLVNTGPPYNVKVETRSNNAIAAGLSLFSTSLEERSRLPSPWAGLTGE